MKRLYPSFAPPETWRNSSQAKKLEGDAWKRMREQILKRDNFTCAYCGYRSEKYQIVDHIDGNPENNDDDNLQVICQMCNLVKHAGQGCVVKGIVDLYKKSKYSQNDVIRITREMRDNGASDGKIIIFLGLEGKAPFRMDRVYLKNLFGFVTARKTDDSMYNGWLSYHRKIKGVAPDISGQAKLDSFMK
jgi:hypothetical protein